MANVGLTVILTALPLAPPPVEAQEPAAAPIVFVCEHGSVKSIIAALWFNRLAAEQGLALVGVSRGVDPDAEVPAEVAAQLRRDGFDLAGVTPVALQTDDLTTAVHVIAIGTSSPLFSGLRSQPEVWDDIPPASVDYGAARDAIRLRLEGLLKGLAGTPSKGQRP